MREAAGTSCVVVRGRGESFFPVLPSEQLHAPAIVQSEGERSAAEVIAETIRTIPGSQDSPSQGQGLRPGAEVRGSGCLRDAEKISKPRTSRQTENKYRFFEKVKASNNSGEKLMITTKP